MTANNTNLYEFYLFSESTSNRYSLLNSTRTKNKHNTINCIINYTQYILKKLTREIKQT